MNELMKERLNELAAFGTNQTPSDLSDDGLQFHASRVFLLFELDVTTLPNGSRAARLYCRNVVKSESQSTVRLRWMVYTYLRLSDVDYPDFDLLFDGDRWSIHSLDGTEFLGHQLNHVLAMVSSASRNLSRLEKMR